MLNVSFHPMIIRGMRTRQQKAKMSTFNPCGFEMKKILQSTLLLGMFVVGVLAYPTWHKERYCCIDVDCASCPTGKTSDDDSHHNKAPHHDSSKCPICQLANTPLLSSVPVVSPVAIVLSTGNLPFSKFSIPSSEPRGAALARGPPVA
jgi:hypothetical protein